MVEMQSLLLKPNASEMKLIKFCQLETESHDTSECDTIGGHMLQLARKIATVPTGWFFQGQEI